MTGHRTLVASAAMVGCAAAWGLATVLTKGTLDLVPPFTLLALQLSASVAALSLAILLQGRLPRRDAALRRASLTGLLEPGLAYAVGVPGVALTTAGASALISATEPAFVVLVAWVLYAQRPGARMICCIIAAMLGVALVSVTGAAQASAPAPVTGNLLILLGTAFAGLYVVISSRMVVDIAPLDLALSQHAVGLLLAVALAVSAMVTGLEPAALPGGHALLLALTSGVLQYALPFWLFLTAVRTIPVARAALFLALTPVFGVIGGVVFLGEVVAPLQAMGAILILAAIIAVSRI